MEEIKLDLVQMKEDLRRGVIACSQRGLIHSAKWFSELHHSLSHIKTTPDTTNPFSDCEGETEAYFMAKSYFDSKEYDRCAYFTKKCQKPINRFLYFYSKYYAIGTKKLLKMTDAALRPDPTACDDFVHLYTELEQDYHDNKLDGFCLYLYGVILRKKDLPELAIRVFVKAVNLEPLLWCAWYELGQIIPDKNTIFSLQLPDHWIKHFFLAHAYLEQLNNDEALQIYFELYSQGLKDSTYLMAQTAIGHHNRRELVKAIDLFKQILSVDPYRLDNLDTYSNLLYVQELKTELGDLAQKVVLVDEYRVETCCVIGNFYSLRSDHAKAVIYFRRALKINPQFLSAWTLMGHEYMEMKNTNAAIKSYRHAIEINNRDYRAWYGLGQTYEILKMHFYSLYYYKKAQQLKPNDSRMIIALGETYEKLENTENALKCYYKAYKMGDIEGQVLIKLAKLYDKLKEFDFAAAAFTDYCLREEYNKTRSIEDENEYYGAFQYLANYHLKKGNFGDAYTYAYKCIEHEKTKEIAKSLLKEIAARREDLENQKIEPGGLPDNLEGDAGDAPMDISTRDRETDAETEQVLMEETVDDSLLDDI